MIDAPNLFDSSTDSFHESILRKRRNKPTYESLRKEQKMRIRQFKELSKDITFSVDERKRFAKYASGLKKEHKQDKIKRGLKQKQKALGSHSLVAPHETCLVLPV